MTPFDLSSVIKKIGREKKVLLREQKKIQRRLRQIKKLVTSLRLFDRTSGHPSKRGKFKRSKKARLAISRAQKARWAKIRAAKG